MDNAGLEPKSHLPPSMRQLLRGDQIAVILTDQNTVKGKCGAVFHPRGLLEWVPDSTSPNVLF